MTVEEATKLLTPEALEHLSEVVCPWDIEINKVDCDVVMSALCKAVTEKVIKKASLDENLITLLNSDTATLSASKLEVVLKTIYAHQNISCIIKLYRENDKTAFIYRPTGNDFSYNLIFDHVIDSCQVTSIGIRHNMEGKYKSSVINNIAQLLRKHETNPNEPISIKHISRIFTSYGGIISCIFCNHDDVKNEISGYKTITWF